jgi:hypothetical protein
MATNQGPASGNGVIPIQLPGGPVTTGIEVQVPIGAPSLEPSRAPFVDPGQAGTTITGAQITPINTTFTFGNTGATVRFANPA